MKSKPGREGQRARGWSGVGFRWGKKN